MAIPVTPPDAILFVSRKSDTPIENMIQPNVITAYRIKYVFSFAFVILNILYAYMHKMSNKRTAADNYLFVFRKEAVYAYKMYNL